METQRLMRQTTGIFGIPIDNLDTQATMERLEQFIQEGRFHQVATANADFLINAMHDQEVRQILRDADLVTPDGMPVVWASRLLGYGLHERVTGADLVPKLAVMAAEKGYRIYMLGAHKDVAQLARERLIEANPTLQIVGCVSPDVSPLLRMNSEELLLDICQAKPDILLVAFGNPKQEKWIHLHRDRLRHIPVCMGVGGTFDFLAGQTSRAPAWMQRLGLEWLYRLAQEPKRLWKRYRNDLIYFPRFLARQWRATQAQPRSTAKKLSVEFRENHAVIHIEAALNVTLLSEFHTCALNALENSPNLILQLYPESSIDAAALGTLLTLSKRAERRGGELAIVGGGPTLLALLRATYADERIKLYATEEEALQPGNPAALQIVIYSNDTRAVCTLKGSADYRQVRALQDKLELLPHAITQINIEMQDINYIDCGMLNWLRHYSRMAEATGRCVRLNVNHLVRNALQREQILEEFALVDPDDATPSLTNLSTSAVA